MPIFECDVSLGIIWSVLETHNNQEICDFFSQHAEHLDFVFPQNIEFKNFSGVTPFMGAVLDENRALADCLSALGSDPNFMHPTLRISASLLYKLGQFHSLTFP